jgi:D-alanyl-D-alanine carboxypeptidase
MKSQLVSRRTILTGAIKAGAGLALLNQLNLGTLSALAIEPAKASADDARFQPAFARLDEFIAAHLADVGAPGMTLALATRDGLLRASGYGFADLKTQAKVQTGTLFEIGSISKSFVALALMQIYEEGKYDPTKPVTAYLPWLKIESKFAPITGHHLLSHTAGLPGGVTLGLMGLETPLWVGYAPGEHFAYSNVGYDLLGLTLEAIDKQPMAVVLRKRVLDPLGMTASEPVITNSTRSRMAIGYGPMHDDRPFPRRGQLAEAPWIEVAEGAGSVASTATDMGTYLTMLIHRGKGARGRVISEETFARFITPATKAPFRGEPANYAYGLWVNDVEDHTYLRHTGGMVAFSSALHVDLKSGIGAFASANANLAGYRPVLVARYALDLLRATLDGKELPAMPAMPPALDLVQNASDYAGTYTSGNGKKLTLVAEGTRLLLVHDGKRIALERTGRDNFIVRHPDFELFTLDFGREQNAVVEASHGADWFTNERYAGPKKFSYPPEWDAFVGNYRNDSPWFGNARVYLRKGKLTIDGAPVTPLSNGNFRVGGEEWSPERLNFAHLRDGRAQRMTFSGVEFYRTPVP